MLISKNKIKLGLGILFFVIVSLVALNYFPLLKYYTNHAAAYQLWRLDFRMHGLVVLTLVLASLIYMGIDKLWLKNPPKISAILGILTILSLILIWVFPIGASDIFLYLLQARIFAIHGLNPYLSVYSQLSGDVFYPLLRVNPWAGYTSSYGPLFTLITSGLSIIFKSNFLASVILFKSFWAALHLVNTWLISKALGKRYAWLYAFNPLLLFEFLINGHNEVVLIFFCLLAFYFLWKKAPNLKNSLLSVGFLTLGILIKFIPLILLPIWSLALLWRLNSKIEKRLFISLSVILFLALSFLVYLPFWQNWTIIFNPIISQIRFSNYLLASPLITFIYLFGAPWKTAILVGQGLFLTFLLFMTGRIIREWRKKDVKKLLNYGTIIMGVFYASFFSWLMPWYFSFLLLLLLISHYLNGRDRYLILFYAITIIGSIYYLILR